uniref:tripartite motif-containing protein 16-like n=1 Tax=Solea senegalensis TaxID=28829 RepID=UPI001CD8EF09|nr:tripartite motif-containing protein 16-like [Solea senegalensis]XP_043873984.1 tripartite motif-containing protein 16-like [Solea senegalensis]XP_043873985.1 tripartite motif-containing protein 16-like [Solea senegalensis]
MAGVQLHRETLSCSICLDLLKDPVTLTCGDSFCKNCIKDHREEQRRSCPHCREIFKPRSKLKKDLDLVEELKKTGLHAAPADHCYAGAEDVACDVCTGRKRKALNNCLVCLASYCEGHLQPHLQAPALKKHKLVEPSKNLQENICPRHDKMMDLFCRTDQQCICYLCSVDEHKDHDTVSAAAERTHKQRELDLSREEVQQKLQDIDRDVKVLQQERKTLTLSADKTVKDTDESFTEMMRLLQKRSSDVMQLIRSKLETEVRRVTDAEEKLQQEITELKKKEAELKQLSLTHDHNQFLLNYRSLSALSPSTHSSTIHIRPLRHFEDVTAAVAKDRGQLQDFLIETWTNISLAVEQVDVLLTEPEPKTRAEFFRYSQEIKLDPNTAHTELLLSEGNRKVTLMNEPQSYPHQTDRFTDVYQVLSEESVTGRCYWEVEWTGRGVSVAVTYKNISSSGSDECVFGYNYKSWALDCDLNSCEFVHNSIKTVVSGVKVSKVGVYLDYRAGLLSFYRVSDTMTLLHRVQIMFTQPLYAGVWLCYSSLGATAEFCKLK